MAGGHGPPVVITVETRGVVIHAGFQMQPALAIPVGDEAPGSVVSGGVDEFGVPAVQAVGFPNGPDAEQAGRLGQHAPHPPDEGRAFHGKAAVFEPREKLRRGAGGVHGRLQFGLHFRGVLFRQRSRELAGEPLRRFQGSDGYEIEQQGERNQQDAPELNDHFGAQSHAEFWHVFSRFFGFNIFSVVFVAAVLPIGSGFFSGGCRKKDAKEPAGLRPTRISGAAGCKILCRSGKRITGPC